MRDDPINDLPPEAQSYLVASEEIIFVKCLQNSSTEIFYQQSRCFLQQSTD